MIKRALITVSDKKGIVDLAKNLHQQGIEIISTGGTYKEIHSNNVPVITVEEHTGFKEILGGRVKTLNPLIHGGILALRDDQNHVEDLKSSNIKVIDLVVVNLYPFEKVIKDKQVSANDVIENIDIGGVALLRASAKNFRYVTVLTDPDDYPVIISELKNHKEISDKLRFELAIKAFKLTSHYDSIIYKYLTENKSIFLN